MAGGNIYTLSDADMVTNGELVKILVLETMVKEGILQQEHAEQWAESHGIVVNHGSMFRKIFDRATKQPPTAPSYQIVKRSIY